MRCTLIALAGACLAVSAAAEVYKSVGPDGSVTYSESPPPGTKSVRIEVKTTKPDPVAIERLQAGQAAQAQADTALAEQSAKQATEAKSAATKADNCARARANLEQLQSAIRIYETNNLGERTRVGEEQRQGNIDRMNEIVKKNCI